MNFTYFRIHFESVCWCKCIESGGDDDLACEITIKLDVLKLHYIFFLHEKSAFSVALLCYVPISLISCCMRSKI